eukprot:11172393-Lingulodinium_polyedra.AAC.1
MAARGSSVRRNPRHSSSRAQCQSHDASPSSISRGGGRHPRSPSSAGQRARRSSAVCTSSA